MRDPLSCTFSHASTSYEIEIQRELLKDPLALREQLLRYGSRFALITDHTVASLYGNSLVHSLRNKETEIFLFSFPSGESYKTRATKAFLEDQLFAQKLGRDTCVIALGGGVVTDMAGHLAATYCRGIPLILIPTSLLAMVDACIGGKTSINVPEGKNMVGSIYHPQKVLIDPSTLSTLSRKELKNGVVEMIKHGLVADASFFEYLEKHPEQLLALHAEKIEAAIFASCRIKKEIVEQDEKEKGKRRLLNFGHTIGHALETLSQYSLSHGEAVAIGLLVEAHLATQLGVLNEQDERRIQQILRRYDIPLRLPISYSYEALLEAMILDKKSLRGQPRFVILATIGSPLAYEGTYCTPVQDKMLRKAWQWIHQKL